MNRGEKLFPHNTKSNWQLGELGLISGLPCFSAAMFPRSSACQHQTSVLAGVQVIIRREGRDGHHPSLTCFTHSLSCLSILIRIFGLAKQCVYFQSFPAQQQNDLSSSAPLSAAWHTRAALLSPGRSFQAANAYLSHLDFWHECDSYVHQSISFLCFTFHSTKQSFMNPFLGVHSKALQWSPGSIGLSLLFIACLLHPGYGKGYTTIVGMLMLHPRTLRKQPTMSRGKVMQAREINKSGDGPTADPEAQTTGHQPSHTNSTVFLLSLWLYSIIVGFHPILVALTLGITVLPPSSSYICSS